MSIFNFSQFRVFRNAVPMAWIAFLGFCVLLVVIPVYLFDRISPPLWIGLWIVTWALAWRFTRAYRRHLALFSAALFLFFAGGEAYFRLRYFGVEGLSLSLCRPASFAHPWSGFEFDPSTYTGVKGNQYRLFRGRPFTVNNRGFRGRDYTLEKPADTYRIVLAGPSAALGSGIADDRIFTARMEAYWNETLPAGRVEVINLSIGGSTVGEMLHVLREAGLQYDPDMLMLCMNRSRVLGGNLTLRQRQAYEVEPSPWKRFLDPRYAFFANRFFFFTLIPRTRTTEEAPEDDEERPDRSERLESARITHERVVEEFRSIAGTRRMAAYILRPVSRLDVVGPDRRYRRWLREFVEGEGILFVDTYEADLRGYQEKDLMIYPGDKHPNAILHRHYAGAFIKALDPVVRRDIEARLTTDSK